MPVPSVVYEGVQGAPTLFVLPVKFDIPNPFNAFPVPVRFTCYVQQSLIDTVSVSIRWSNVPGFNGAVTDANRNLVSSVTPAPGLPLAVLVNTVQQPQDVPALPGRIQFVAGGQAAPLLDKGPNLPQVMNASPAVPLFSWYMTPVSQFDFFTPLYVGGVVSYCGSNVYVSGGNSNA